MEREGRSKTVSSVQFSHSVMSDSETPMNHSMPGLPVHHQLPEFIQTHELVMPSSHLILCHPLLLPPTIFPSIRVFSNESALRIRWSNYWEFQLQHQSFQWISRTDILQDGLVGSPCSPRDSQHHSSEASILQHSAFFRVQLSHLYMTTEKTIALMRWTFVGKVMSLLFNMLSRLRIQLFFQGANVF